MKTYLLSIFLLLVAATNFAQTAVNFTTKDCNGVTHDLFNELDSGKVVVLCWVMPCATCIPASLTTSNIVLSYQETYPGKVLYYLVDDLANTSCSSLKSWGSSNHLTTAAVFSDPSINMLDYGTPGMPKVVVIGGASHHVFMVANGVVDPVEIQNAINAAVITSSIVEKTNNESWVKISPNPAGNKFILTIITEKELPVKAELLNSDGLQIETVYKGSPTRGENQININISKYPSGVYFIRASDADRSKTIKLIIAK